MRLTLSFIVLLIVATTAVSYVWRSLGGFSDASALHQATILLGGLTAIVSSGLLARIVVKASIARK